MAELFLPTLHTFAMNNIFTGSVGLFRFRAKPNVIMATPKEVDFTQSTIEAEFWQKHHGGSQDLPHDRRRPPGALRLAGKQYLTQKPQHHAAAFFMRK